MIPLITYPLSRQKQDARDEQSLAVAVGVTIRLAPIEVDTFPANLRTTLGPRVE